MRERTRLKPLILFPVMFLCVGAGNWIGNHLYGRYAGPDVDWRRAAIAGIAGGIGVGLTLGLQYLIARKRRVN